MKCSYCGCSTVFVDSAVIYGKSYGMVYLCKPCDAYVGTHKHDNKPLGTIANRELRDHRKQAHLQFDSLYKNKLMSRTQAYKWLQGVMSLPASQAHIAMFDVEQCKKLIYIMDTKHD